MSTSSSDNTESISYASSSSINGECSTDSNGEHRELLPLDSTKSHVWEYFGFPAENGDFTLQRRTRRKEL